MIWFSVWFSNYPYVLYTNYSIMFVQPSNLKSSSIETLKVDVANNNVVVKFLNNVRHYIYQGVFIESIVSFFHDELSAVSLSTRLRLKMVYGLLTF